jgi:hypothetical protein
MSKIPDIEGTIINRKLYFVLTNINNYKLRCDTVFVQFC